MDIFHPPLFVRNNGTNSSGSLLLQKQVMLRQELLENL